MTLCRCHISKQCTVGLSECRMYTHTDELQKWLNCDPSTPHQLLSVQYWQTYHFTIMSNISLLLIIDSVAVARLDKGCQQGGFGGGGAAVAMVMRWSTVEFRSSSDPQVSSVEWKCQDILNALFFGRLLHWSQHTHTHYCDVDMNTVYSLCMYHSHYFQSTKLCIMDMKKLLIYLTGSWIAVTSLGHRLP